MKPLIAANWKMNLDLTSATQLVRQINLIKNEISNVDIMVFPSHCYLSLVASVLNQVGAQNVSEYAPGAYTGEVSAEMLKSCGVTHALVGHSERRHIFFETDDILTKKLYQLKSVGIVPIFCVGETLDQRNRVESVIQHQLQPILSFDAPYIIAYEPVWAIGTGQSSTPEDAQSVHEIIQSMVGPGVQILYGGSVTESNLLNLLKMPNIHGALVGGASLKTESFTSILNIASKYEQGALI
jgi:triosephosphate isomerase